MSCIPVLFSDSKMRYTFVVALRGDGHDVETVPDGLLDAPDVVRVLGIVGRDDLLLEELVGVRDVAAGAVVPVRCDACPERRPVGLGRQQLEVVIAGLPLVDQTLLVHLLGRLRVLVPDVVTHRGQRQEQCREALLPIDHHPPLRAHSSGSGAGASTTDPMKCPGPPPSASRSTSACATMSVQSWSS